MNSFHDQVQYAVPYIMTRTRPSNWNQNYALHLQYHVQARHYQMGIAILPFATEQVWTNTYVQFFMPVSLPLLRTQADVGSSLIKLLALLLCHGGMLPALPLMLWAFPADRINASSRHTRAYT